MSRVKPRRLGGPTDLTLKFADSGTKAPLRRGISGLGFAAEHVCLDGSEGFDYRWSGNSHYLAIHDIQLSDGEAVVDGSQPDRTRDLRNTITFIPRGCSIAGWSKPVRRANSFTAITFDTDQLKEELEHRYSSRELRPLLYFNVPALQLTLLKLQALLMEPIVDDLHAESLCLLAAVEFLKASGRPETGKLSQRQLARVFGFVAENLSGEIRLQDMADAAGLSRYHFSRAFKQSVGEAPYNFVLRRRIEDAAKALTSSDAAVEAVARSVGFRNTSQFSRAFRQIKGLSPQAFRRSTA